MSSAAHSLGHNFGAKLIQAAGLVLSDDGRRTTSTGIAVIPGTGAPAGAYWLNPGMTAVYIREDASEAADAMYYTVDGGTTWNALFGDVVVSADISASGSGVAVSSEQLQTRTATLTLTNTPIPLADEAGVVAFGGLKIADLPEGAVCILGAVLDLDLTKNSAGVNDDWDGDISLGTATASNNASLSGGEADIVPSTPTPQASGGATTGNAVSTTTECPVLVDGTSGAAGVYLNVLVDDADHDVTSTACNLIVNGTVTLTYVLLGDY